MTGNGYIEKRQVLLDGKLPHGDIDRDKPQKTMYFAQVESPWFWWGPLCDTIEDAKRSGRDHCKPRDVDVPAFRAVMDVD